ncbi:MAG: DUF935 family protein, partial [Verrucomicrobiota bacterium]
TTGRLRFIESEGAIEGRDLEEGGWLVTVGDGVMFACAVAYMFKLLPIRDWLRYCERHGMPGLRGVTNAPRGSKEWQAMADALEEFNADFAAVMNENERIERIDVTSSGELPHPQIVERMDRALAALWRGADLSTISKGDGLGASLQGDESLLLEQDDAELISETLNLQVDTWVIRHLFGDDVKPLAYVRLLTEQPRNIEQDLKVDEFLVRHGVPLGVANALERYGRSAAKEGEGVLGAKGE